MKPCTFLVLIFICCEAVNTSSFTSNRDNHLSTFAFLKIEGIKNKKIKNLRFCRTIEEIGKKLRILLLPRSHDLHFVYSLCVWLWCEESEWKMESAISCGRVALSPNQIFQPIPGNFLLVVCFWNFIPKYFYCL